MRVRWRRAAADAHVVRDRHDLELRYVWQRLLAPRVDLVQLEPELRAALNEHDIGGGHAAKARVPCERIAADVLQHHAVGELRRLHDPLADHVFFVTSRPDELHLAARTGMRSARDELDLAPAQMTHAR